MLATKNRAGRNSKAGSKGQGAAPSCSLFRLPAPGAVLSASLMLAVLLAGCTPPGPRALLDGKRLLDEG